MVDTSGVSAASAFDAIQNAQSSASSIPSDSTAQSLFDSANAVALQANGKIVLCGVTRVNNGAELDIA